MMRCYSCLEVSPCFPCFAIPRPSSSRASTEMSGRSGGSTFVCRKRVAEEVGDPRHHNYSRSHGDIVVGAIGRGDTNVCWRRFRNARRAPMSGCISCLHGHLGNVTGSSWIRNGPCSALRHGYVVRRQYGEVEVREGRFTRIQEVRNIHHSLRSARDRREQAAAMSAGQAVESRQILEETRQNRQDSGDNEADGEPGAAWRTVRLRMTAK